MQENQFKQFLKSKGFTITEIAYAVFVFSNDKITGLYSFEFYLQEYSFAARKVIADNKKSFNKWSQCPFFQKIDNINDLEVFYKNLEWLASDEGEKYSNEFLYLDKPVIPYEQ